MNNLRQLQALAEARSAWARAAQAFDQLLQKATESHTDMIGKANALCKMGQRAHSQGKGHCCTCLLYLGPLTYFKVAVYRHCINEAMVLGEIKLAALQLQTATQAYDNQAKAFEHQVLRLTAADGT